MKKAMKKAPVKKMKTGGMENPNATVTVNKTPTKYTGGMNAAATVNKVPTKYTGGKQTPPTGAVPAAKYGTMMKKGGAMSKYKSGGQGPANKIGKMVKISKKK
jgi:hypothetical protein